MGKRRQSDCGDSGKVAFGKQKQVRFATESEVISVEPAWNWPLELKSLVWIQQTDLMATVDDITSTVDELFRVNPTETSSYIMSLAEVYLNCTGENEDDKDSTALNTHVANMIRTQSCLLRGLETHVLPELLQERSRRRTEHVSTVKQFHQMLWGTTGHCDVLVAAVAASSSRASTRFAVVMGTTDAIAAHDQPVENSTGKTGLETMEIELDDIALPSPSPITSESNDQFSMINAAA